MRAGRLNQRITLEKRTMVQDAFGSATPTWSEVATVWATLTRITGREDWANDQVTTESAVAFRIRYLAGLSADMRLQHNGTTYEIQTILDPTSRGRELIITARAEQ